MSRVVAPPAAFQSGFHPFPAVNKRPDRASDTKCSCEQFLSAASLSQIATAITLISSIITLLAPSTHYGDHPPEAT
jgi:hypothetical protein